MAIEYDIEAGCVVGYAPGTPFQARVPLRKVAEAFESAGKLSLSEQERRHYQGMHGSETEIGAKKSAPRGFQRVVKAAKKAANSKIIRNVRKVMSVALPGPFGMAVRAAPLAKKLAKRQKSGPPKARANAKKAAAVSRQMAAGKRIAPKKLAKIAKKLGVSAAEIKAGAAMGALASSAQRGNPAARQTATAIARLDQAEDTGDAQAAVDVAQDVPPEVLEQAAPPPAPEEPEQAAEPEPPPEDPGEAPEEPEQAAEPEETGEVEP